MEFTNCPLCNSDSISFFVTNFKNKDFWKCKKCSFVFSSQENIPNYSDASWDHMIDPDNKIRDLTNEKEFKIKNWYGDIIPFMNDINPGKILDVGCGLGYLISSFSNKWEKYGFELSEFAVSYINKNFPEINMIKDLDLEKSEPSQKYKEKFDVIICYHVIEHVKNINYFINSLSMLLKNNGILIIGTPNINSLMAKIFKGNFRLLGDEGHISLFNKKTMNSIFKENHFEVINIEYPFFKTDYFTIKNLIKILNVKSISPPFYGNIMTFYAQKKK